MAKIKIGVVDDHTLFRQGIAGLLNSRPDLEVVLEASDGFNLLEQLEEKQNIPHVLLMDIQMPNMNGLEATQKVSARYPRIKIIGLTMHQNDQVIHQLVQNGACGFLPKHADMDVVIRAIKTVRAKGYYLDEKISGVLMRGNLTAANPGGILKAKEVEILKLICSEHSVKEIGRIMKLSHRTVEGHKLRIQEKIGAKNVVGMVLYALNNQLLPISLNC